MEKENSQTGNINRYKLFLSNPKKPFRRPLVGLGMLFMKACEARVFFWGGDWVFC